LRLLKRSVLDWRGKAPVETSQPAGPALAALYKHGDVDAYEPANDEARACQRHGRAYDAVEQGIHAGGGRYCQHSPYGHEQGAAGRQAGHRSAEP
jgi:hypothetical protein